MRVIIYNAKKYEIPYFLSANQNKHELRFVEEPLDLNSVQKITNEDAICCFVTDQLDRTILEQLKQKNVKLITLRSAGFDHVDLEAAKALDLVVARVPAYSPHAVAEFTVGLLLALTRKIVQADRRIQRHNFSLDGQLGFNLQGKTIGIIGTGYIGKIVAKILSGFDCVLLGYDPMPNDDCKTLGVSYMTLEMLLKKSDIITLHCPLNKDTYHLINADTIALMKSDVVLVNTGRGALLNTQAIINGLKNKKIGALGVDVYEKEKGLFFQDHSNDIILDDQFIRLQAFPNVLITSHQAFLSKEAHENIVQITIDNLSAFESGVVQNGI